MGCGENKAIKLPKMQRKEQIRDSKIQPGSARIVSEPREDGRSRATSDVSYTVERIDPKSDVLLETSLPSF